MNLRPLRKIEPGVYVSATGTWTFMRHESDPRPKRWFAYYQNHGEPTFFTGHFSLKEAVAAVERHASL